MQSTAPASPYQCIVCSTSFNRVDHLNRHLLVHTDIRPFRCTFCALAFTRRDALIRHWKVCDARITSGQAVPHLSQRKRGRKLHACDRCSRVKKRCSRTSPCIQCLDGNQECTYLRFLQDADSNNHSAISIPEDNEKNISPADPDLVLDTIWDIPEEGQLNSKGRVPESGTSIRMPDPVAEEVTMFPHMGLPLDPALPPNNGESCLLVSWTPWSVYDMAVHASNFVPRPQISPPRLAFLGRFTSTMGLANSFDCGNPEYRRRAILILTAPTTSENPPYSKSGTTLASPIRHSFYDLIPRRDYCNSWQLDLPTDFFGCGGDYQSVPESEFLGVLPRDLLSDEWVVHPLSVKTCEIVHGVKQYLHSQNIDGINSRDRTTPNETLCRQFFAPENLEMYLVAFWSFWYPNWPVFHKPTFDPTKSPAPLLATIALIGACLTSERTDRDRAMLWLRAVEEWVFSDPTFCDDASESLDDDETDDLQVRDRLNALRAAYCIVLLYSWEGNEYQKRHARRTRFSQVIAAARVLQRRSSSTHGDLRTYLRISNAQTKWEEFILKEELIRTLTYVFLLDMGYVIFNNTPPRMVTFELNYGLACPESCFQANDLESWIFSVKSWSETEIGQTQPLVSSVLESLMKDQISTEDLKMLKQMSLLNFFTIASAFHGQLFRHHCEPTSWNQVFPIRNALRHWKYVWLQREEPCGLEEPEDTMLSEAWRRIGFMRYALEFWCLGCIIYWRAESMRSLMLNGTKRISGPIKKGFLEKYDHSDMQQVHELVAQFQETNLGDCIM